MGEISGRAKVEEVATGTNDVVNHVSPDECCRVLRKWLAENKQLREVERADMTQLINEHAVPDRSAAEIILPCKFENQLLKRLPAE